MSQADRRITDLVRNFFDKLLLPVVKAYPHILSEWKHFISLLSTSPPDYSKLELYIASLHFDGNNHLTKSLSYNQPSLAATTADKKQTDSKIFRKERVEERLQEYKTSKPLELLPEPHLLLVSEDISSKEVNKAEDGRRRIVSTLEAFQSMLVSNQQRLEQDYKKDKRGTQKVYDERRR